MAKLAIKSDTSILSREFSRFSTSSTAAASARSLTGISASAAFTHGDVFASMFGSFLCGGDCSEDVMEMK